MMKFHGNPRNESCESENTKCDRHTGKHQSGIVVIISKWDCECVRVGHRGSLSVRVRLSSFKMGQLDRKAVEGVVSASASHSSRATIKELA